jgi:hypothetical protein
MYQCLDHNPATEQQAREECFCEVLSEYREFKQDWNRTHAPNDPHVRLVAGRDGKNASMKAVVNKLVKEAVVVKKEKSHSASELLAKATCGVACAKTHHGACQSKCQSEMQDCLQKTTQKKPLQGEFHWTQKGVDLMHAGKFDEAFGRPKVGDVVSEKQLELATSKGFAVKQLLKDHLVSEAPKDSPALRWTKVGIESMGHAGLSSAFGGPMEGEIVSKEQLQVAAGRGFDIKSMLEEGLVSEVPKTPEIISSDTTQTELACFDGVRGKYQEASDRVAIALRAKREGSAYRLKLKAH